MLDGALCAFAVMASMQSLKTPGRISPTRRQALRDAAGVGTAVIETGVAVGDLVALRDPAASAAPASPALPASPAGVAPRRGQGASRP